jgi:glutamate-1-semialdehyde 2,1-aminomutase
MHGWHDWCAVRSPGVLAEVKSYTHALQYGDIDQIRKLFKELQGDIACIVMMPYEIAQPPDGYFDEIRSICDLHGALLVLDEVRSGFRVSLGGAQEKFGINADLIALSKAMANGHPISALAGRKLWMSQILKLGLTVTFYRGPIEIAAALATITQLEDMDGPGILSKVGGKIIREANKVIEAIDIPASVKGERTSPGIVFGYGDRYDNDRALRLFCHSMIRSGVLINPAHHWFLSTEIGEHDADYIVGAIEEALRCVKGSI